MDLDNYEAVVRIVVIGVGGAGSNAVNRMMDEHIDNVEFYVLNTDKQALATSKAPNRLVLGEEITQGLGAGGDPQKGREAALASTEQIRAIVKGVNMVFIAAGMGGGTGTGAAPIVAQIAKEEGCLTVGIVTRPFTFEGKVRIAHSVEGLSELKEAVEYAESKTKDYSDYHFNVAVAYGGRQEIINAVKRVAQMVKDGEMEVEDITEDSISGNMYTSEDPDPDLVLRTSGEFRLSNFLIWQLAYSELYFTDIYWPGFRYIDFLRAIRSYQQRNRRYGT